LKWAVRDERDNNKQRIIYMTIKVTITHDEPTSEHNIYVAYLQDISGYDCPQIKQTKVLKPGESASLYVHSGQQIQVWEAPLEIELKVADEIERAMRDPMNVGAKSPLDNRLRIKVARAAIAAARTIVNIEDGA
jgi:hypothetical protein